MWKESRQNWRDRVNLTLKQATHTDLVARITKATTLCNKYHLLHTFFLILFFLVLCLCHMCAGAGGNRKKVLHLLELELVWLTAA